MARDDEDPMRAELDRLAASLGRSVSVDDPDGGLVGYSVQAGDADEARIAAILTRRVPAAVQQWQDEQGVRAASEPFRLPANPALGMAERWCVPIREGDVALGYLWVLEADRTLSQAELRAATEAAIRVRDLLLGRGETQGTVRQADRLLRSLVSSRGRPDTADVAQELAELVPSLADGVSWFTAFVPTTAGRDGIRTVASSAATGLQSVLASGLRTDRSYVASCVLPAHGVVLHVGSPREAARVSTKVERLVSKQRADPGSFAFGTSEPTELETSLYRSGVEQALAAARCAGVDPALSPRTAWSELGAYQLLSTADDLHGIQLVLAPLVGEGSGPMLLDTLETYLDLACDARRTSARLNLHRTSLYYRLGRISELLGVDLADGMTRTHLHLAVKGRRLARGA
jgi:hypothetical protein